MNRQLIYGAVAFILNALHSLLPPSSKPNSFLIKLFNFTNKNIVSDSNYDPKYFSLVFFRNFRNVGGDFALFCSQNE